jgi:hypothetical protein
MWRQQVAKRESQCSVVLGELLNGQEADVLHGEMESPNADAQKVLAAIPEAITQKQEEGEHS